MNMREIKIVLIGAGSTYTPELVEGLIEHRRNLNIRELAFMDIDPGKLKIVGEMARRMINRAGAAWPVKFYDTYDCVENADYVLTQIRVGQLAARINDEKIPLKYGLIGQETCGIGGFFKALRTIPVLLKIADVIETKAPDALMINFTNPSGIAAQALSRRKIKSVGLCNCPYAMEKSVKEALRLPDAEIEYVGLNHLSWLTGIRYDGKDYLRTAIENGINGEAMKNIPANGFSKEVLQTVRAIPSTYLEYYYFRMEKLKKLQAEPKSRGEVCKDIEKELLEKYKDKTLDYKPKELELRGGAYYSKVAVSLLEAVENDRQTRHVVNVKNEGALPFMDDGDVVEVAATVGKNGIIPRKITGFDNGHIISMMRGMKSYEKMVVKAALTGRREDALQALLSNPLAGDYAAASACYDELYGLNKAFLQGGKGEENRC
jgi:6-phospho-beta-glucosidase